MLDASNEIQKISAETCELTEAQLDLVNGGSLNSVVTSVVNAVANGISAGIKVINMDQKETYTGKYGSVTF